MDVERVYVEKDLTEAVIGAEIAVHQTLGPGLLESAYEACLSHELTRRGVVFRTQVTLPVHYHGIDVECGYRIDLLVANALIVEIKAVDELHPIHEAQLLTYLKLSRIRVGLLINFNTRLLKDGIKRRVL